MVGLRTQAPYTELAMSSAAAAIVAAAVLCMLRDEASRTVWIARRLSHHFFFWYVRSGFEGGFTKAWLGEAIDKSFFFPLKKGTWLLPQWRGLTLTSKPKLRLMALPTLSIIMDARTKEFL
ncbi:hypothetical protein K2173_011821 [Erythroxylum novogranatense]|uniref:Uncharacterized protein n=1 Tax=Erythroxylum novogranatense TaxID=1862640 RepID=A0AAV8SLW8_9ROSI|nr:hypothetical protein K2173_011821 [Erythroxylum novogranatense]